VKAAKVLDIGLLGDISFGLSIDEILQKYGYDFPLEKIKSRLNSYDCNIANFDCTVTNSESKNPLRDGSHLKTKPEAISTLQSAKINILSLSNNHICDYLDSGIRDTIYSLNERGVLFSGIGYNSISEYAPAIIERNTIKIGVISATSLVGINSFKSDVFKIASINEDEIITSIRGSINSGVDHVFVSLHWGREFVNIPFKDQVLTARRFIDEGASIVFGHHPHVIGPIEEYNGGVIAYSLGDFMFDQNDNKNLPGRNHSIILNVKLNREKVVDYKVIPITLDEFFRPNIASEHDGDQIIEKIKGMGETLADLEGANREAFKQASEKFIYRQIVSFYKTFKNGGVRGVISKVARARLKHINLFYHWLKK